MVTTALKKLVVVIVALIGVGVVAYLLGGWNAVGSSGAYLAVIVALVIAVWSDDLRTLGRSPVLGLTLDPVPDHFQKFHHPGGTWEYDVRLSVTNDGRVAARNVELVATDMAVMGPDGSPVRDSVFMAMNLLRTHYGDTITPMVYRGVPRSYDLLRCIDADLQRAAARKDLLIDFSTFVFPVAAQPVTAADLPEALPSSKGAGKYRLTLAVVADGAEPVKRVVEVGWSGKWRDDAVEFFEKDLTVRLV